MNIISCDKTFEGIYDAFGALNYLLWELYLVLEWNFVSHAAFGSKFQTEFAASQ